MGGSLCRDHRISRIHANARWVRRTFTVGKPGTGKSHTAKAVAYQATLQGLHARYIEADTALAQYALASAQEQAALVKAWSEPDLLVLDDLFLARRMPEMAQ